MRLLALTSSFEHSDGWGRYSLGFIAEARKRFGEANVVASSPRLRLAWDSKPDLIHAMTEPLAPLAMVMSWLTGKPFIISVHGTYGDARAYAWHLRPLYRLAFRQAATVVAVSRYTAEVVRTSFGCKRIEIVSGGFTQRSAAPVGRTLGRPPRLLAVGALKKRKGFHTLLEALDRLKRSGLAVTCRIIGARLSESYAMRLEAFVTARDLGTIVTFEHGVSDGVLDRAYAEADLFVLPSEHDGIAFEGLGLVYLEALALGTPVIGCRQSGAEDVIVDGVNGALVNPAQPDQLAEAIRHLTSDPEQWRAMSMKAPESIASFTWDRVGERMAAIYKNVCASKA